MHRASPAAAHAAAAGFHLTGVTLLAIIAAACVLAYVVSKADMWMPVVVIGLVVVVAWIGLPKLLHAGASPKPKVITRVVTHVVTRPAKSPVSGTDIVIMVVAALIVLLVIKLNKKGI